MMRARVSLVVSASLMCVLALSGCDGEPASAGTSGGSPGGGSGQGGNQRSVVIAATDVGTVELGSISDAIAITGTLRPMETVEIRARLEAALDRVLVREGQQVSAGQLLATFEAIPQQQSLASANAELASAQAILNTATWNFEQSEELFKAGAIPERDLRSAQQDVTSAKARVAAAEALVSSAGLSERDTRVTAPINGVISQKLVDAGEHVSRGGLLFTLVRTNALELAAAVPERRASYARPGQQVNIVAGGRAISGRVSRISPTIDPANRTITVYVDVPNPNNQLRGGSFATGDVIANTVSNTFVIPLDALRRNADGSRTFVYRVNTGNIEEVDVEAGVIDDRNGRVQITRGLAAGDRIVIGNLGVLTDGAPVQIIGGDAPEGQSQ